MATTELNDVERALANGDVSLDNVRFARQLQERASSHKVSAYQQNLRDRLRHRSEAHKPPLHEGKYRTYTLLRGTHTRVEPAARAAADQENASLREAAVKAGQKHFMETVPEETRYHFKDQPTPRLTPLTDNEALMMDQNPTKFGWTGPNEVGGGPTREVDELLAEVERMKTENAALRAANEAKGAKDGKK